MLYYLKYSYVSTKLPMYIPKLSLHNDSEKGERKIL